MKKLTILVGLFGLIGCDDTQMNLGPDESVASGGSAGGNSSAVGAAAGQATGGATIPATGAGGATVPTTGAGGVGATAGTAFAGGNAGAGGDTSFHGIDIEGLQRFTFTSRGGMPLYFNGVCRGPEPEIYALDFATKTLTFEHCAVATDGVTATRAQESRVMSDAELTAAVMRLKLISTNYSRTCGADKQSEVLELDFGDRKARYQDDFYSGCSGAEDWGVTFVSNIDQLRTFLENSLLLPAIPSDYTELTLSISSKTSVNIDWMIAACQTEFRETYVVDFASATLKLSNCGYSALEDRVGLFESSKALTDSEIASIRAKVTALRLGATGDCSQELGFPILWLRKDGEDFPTIVDEHAACPFSRWQAGWSLAMGLDAVYNELASLILPPV